MAKRKTSPAAFTRKHTMSPNPTTSVGIPNPIASIPSASKLTVKALLDEEEFEIDFGASDEDATVLTSDGGKVEELIPVDGEEQNNTAVGGIVDLKTSNEVNSITIALITDGETTLGGDAHAKIDLSNVGRQEVNPTKTDEEVFEAKQDQEWRAVYARQALVTGLKAQLACSPALLSLAGANSVNDTIDITLTVNGLIIDVNFHIVGVEELEDINKETTSKTAHTGPKGKPRGLSIDVEKAQIAPHISAPPSTNPFALLPDTRAQISCKFGDSCTKGSVCPFDHTVVSKKKMCSWLNTAKGCGKSNSCQFSHAHEGKMCSKSSQRSSCKNGATCAFKHTDDGAVGSKATTDRFISKVSGTNDGHVSVHSSTIAAFPSGPALASPLKYANNGPVSVPTGPRNLGVGAGQKRHAEEEGNGYDATRPRKYHNQQHAGHSQGAQGRRKFTQPRGGTGNRGRNGRGGK